MARPLTTRQHGNWDFALFGNPPVSLPEWRHSTTTFISGRIGFPRASRDARALYLRMCAADVNDSGLSTMSEEVYPILQAWDYLRRLHNSMAPASVERQRRSSNQTVVARVPVSGHFPSVNTREVWPRALSKTEVRGVLEKIPKSQEPVYASVSSKVALEAAIRRDTGLFRQLSPRLVVPLPTKHEIAAAIPPQGIAVRDLMLYFSPKLSIKTIATFLERVFVISAMNPVSKKPLPIMSYDQADALEVGSHRSVMINAARSLQTPQQEGNSKYYAFRQEAMDSYFLNQMREMKVAGSRGRMKHLWYFRSGTVDEKMMKVFQPFLEDAERKSREEERDVIKQYTVQERKMKKQRKRKDSVISP